MAVATVVGVPVQQELPTNDVGPLANAQKLCVKQEFAAIELCGIEARNRYRVCVDKPEAEGGQPTMFVGETSEACERVCCAACRSYNLSLHLGQDTSGPVLVTFEKNFHCPMLPWPVLLHPGAWFVTCPMICAAMANRPEMTVKEGGQELGSVIDPPAPLFCCKMDSIIKDANGNEVFHLGPKSMCSCGMACPCCHEERVPVNRDGKEVATVIRTQLSCEEMCLKMNRFEIHFGDVTDATEKKLIVAAAFLLDTQYWDQKG